MSARINFFAFWSGVLGVFAIAAPAIGAPPDVPKLFPAACFTDNMVLQKPPVASNDAALIWGWADKRLDVFVRIGNGAPMHTLPWDEVPTQDPLKPWVIRYRMLGAAPALPNGSFDITISGRRKKNEVATTTLHNVVAGEVWLLVDPEFSVKSAKAPVPASSGGDVRVLTLNTGNFELKPSEAAGIIAGNWQIYGDPHTQINDQLAVSTYYLEAVRSKQMADPVGVLLITQTQWLYYSRYLVEHDIGDLPGADRANPQFAQPWALWKNAWQKAGDEWQGAWANYEKNLVVLKRQGKIPDAPPPRLPHLAPPSIGAGNLPALKYAIRGTLH